MHLPKHQQMLRDHRSYGGVDAVMVIIAKENPGAFTAEALKEIREMQRLADPFDAPIALAKAA
ncbi:hypothetical protein [Paraburkholderia tropica]|uniref:hypothetical protein n=1 Tax=Paraburkholderia tropica TaxID=92647 RepID=UPI001F2D6E45|nr:hypothetical protein [Paraburkholderia tropica]MDE1139557.1 hypothetical protein [Paraburkholderia tropica]